MSDITDFVSQPTDITILGKTYSIKPITVRDMSELQKWVNDRYVNPFSAMLSSLESCSQDTKRLILAEMRRCKPPLIGTEEFQAEITSLEGLQFTFGLIS